MQGVAQTPGILAGPQSLQGGWSEETHLWIRGRQPGDFVELRIPATRKSRLTLYATKSWDYGILRFLVNGQQAGKDFDAWAERPTPSGPIPLGVFEPKNGAFILRVEVVGANPKSRNSKSFFGLDAVTLTEP